MLHVLCWYDSVPDIFLLSVYMQSCSSTSDSGLLHKCIIDSKTRMLCHAFVFGKLHVLFPSDMSFNTLSDTQCD